MTSRARHVILALLPALVLLLHPVRSAAATGLNVGLEGLDLPAFFEGSVFDEDIPTQEQVTGVAPAVRPLRPEEALAYLRALAEASPRASVSTYARSHEGRELVVFAVSDGETVARLEEFRLAHRERVDPRGREAAEDPETLASAKAVAWMAYGIHGDELSSTDAAAALAYWLVAGEDELARRVRRELVVLIDPCENPDGRARFLAQTSSFAHARANPDQDDLSHTTVWPWGRGNHYLFDLNRDWFSQVQPESRRTVTIASWLPQLMVDSHEMGSDSTYLFSPPRHPFNPHLPSSARMWMASFGADQAAALDERGYPYFTREWNEEFFPGYGSSWASYHGAVGILYEMSGTEGTLVRKRGGTERRYAQAVGHQLASSVANLKTAANARAELLADYVRARREIVERGRRGPVRVWVFPWSESKAERLDRLARLLEGQGIELLRLEEAAEASGLHDIRSAVRHDRTLPAGSLMVALDQPAGALARVLLDPHVPMEAEFLREEREYQEKGKGTRLYETTAWSLALAAGVEACWGASRPPGRWTAAGERPGPAGRAPEGDWRSAVFEGRSEASVGALAELLQRGLTPRIAEKSFRAGGKDFLPGTVVVRREGNPEGTAEILAGVADRWGIEIVGIESFLAEEGPDLGGSHFRPLRAPRVGVWSGMPVSPSVYGALWHLLDRQADLRFSALDLARFMRTDLERYNVLVFPPTYQGPQAYRHVLGESGLRKLRTWIEAGGTAIGIGGGASFLASPESGLTRARLRSDALETHPPAVWSLTAAEAERAGRPVANGIRVSATEEKEADSEASAPARASLYDVAPVIGAGARPFLADRDPGTPLPGEPVSMGEWLEPVLPPGRKKPETSDLERADERLRRFMPRGAFLRAELDGEHWLSYGLDPEITVWTGRGEPLVAAPPVRVAARFAELERLHLGGLLWPEAAARIARTAFATREPLGRGQVILFAEDPVFRGWMAQTRRLLLNAILYGPGLGTRWSRPW